MGETRDLTDHERSILEFLIESQWDAAPALRSQLASAKFAGSADSNAAFDVAVEENAPLCSEVAKTSSVGGVYLRVERGVLVGLGCDSAVKTLPPLEKLLAA